MFIKPQILSTPHVTSGALVESAGACAGPYNSGGVSCSTQFSCTPYAGTCTDSTYLGAPITVIVSVVTSV